MTAPQIATIDAFFDGAMRPDVVVRTLSNYDQLFPVQKIARGGEPSTLHARPKGFPVIQFEDRGRAYDINDYLATNRVAGLLVQKDGAVALENYELGISDETRWGSCSMAKSITSTLFGVALKDGYIDSLDDPLPRYVPALSTGAYACVSIRDALKMVSGVAWDETYTDGESARRRLLNVQRTLQPGSVLKHMSSLSRGATPGTAWKYNTGDSYVLCAVLESATGMPLAEYLSARIWSKLGMEHDATCWTEGVGGTALAGSGMSATLRDYGRFGQFVVDGGLIGGASIVPAGWFEEAGARQDVSGQKVPYGYMWWVPELDDPILEGSFQAEGIYGQYLHVNPREHLVIVVLSARSKPSAVSRLELNDEALFAAVARALQ